MLLSARRVARLAPAVRSRALSKVVATITGPCNKEALSTFTRAIDGIGGCKLGGSRSMELSGTVSISSVVFVPEGLDNHELSHALQCALPPRYVVSVQESGEGNAPQAFARVTVTGAERMGILAELADYAESRSLQVSTMLATTDASRYGADGIEGTDDDEDPIYTATCTLASHSPEEDAPWVRNEIYEFGEKAELTVTFEDLTAQA